MVTDAFLLMNFSDINLFVSRISKVTRKVFRNCMNDINLKGIENIYLMLNDVKDINGSRYSYYQYKEKKRKSLLQRIFLSKK